MHVGKAVIREFQWHDLSPRFTPCCMPQGAVTKASSQKYDERSGTVSDTVKALSNGMIQCSWVRCVPDHIIEWELGCVAHR